MQYNQRRLTRSTALTDDNDVRCGSWIDAEEGRVLIDGGGRVETTDIPCRSENAQLRERAILVLLRIKHLLRVLIEHV